MDTIPSFMTAQHRHCDDSFIAAESAVSANDWAQANSQWSIFTTDLELHLTLEESILFPAFEQATGMTMGPTQVMRAEHAQMRQLVEEMSQQLKAQSSADFLGLSETLMILMQQHNMKEEQILYNIMDQRLPDDVNEWQKKFNDWNKQ
ncbi:MAG: hemerythrin domain-containing protein [Moritella sp.]|uniref:hemerythrin domain-containing protein n=1 Tax=Moritella sp. TaxID=78556 RepID=UPI0029BAED1C|nr:hemerythrin domain-containing protein [Moritella sp.]MDX2320125.1 hemerythrin domain-containing protein [Moritella sp.]